MTITELNSQRRCVAYLRVSTREQSDSGAGLKAQSERILREVSLREWALVEVRVDEGISAKTIKDRPALNAAIADIRVGRADTLIAAKLDRLSRSVHDFSGLMLQAKRDGWNLVALDLGIDMTTISGKLMANVMASFAEYERDLIGQRTADALAALQAQGVRLGRPQQLPEDVVAQIVSARRAGATFDRIANTLNDDCVPTAHGGRRWWPASVRAVIGSQSATAQLATS